MATVFVYLSLMWFYKTESPFHDGYSLTEGATGAIHRYLLMNWGMLLLKIIFPRLSKQIFKSVFVFLYRIFGTHVLSNICFDKYSNQITLINCCDNLNIRLISLREPY